MTLCRHAVCAVDLVNLAISDMLYTKKLHSNAGKVRLKSWKRPYRCNVLKAYFWKLIGMDKGIARMLYRHTCLARLRTYWLRRGPPVMKSSLGRFANCSSICDCRKSLRAVSFFLWTTSSVSDLGIYLLLHNPSPVEAIQLTVSGLPIET